MSRTIIITDLDGTLLDSSNYSFEEASSALKRIRELDIPLILCSSKTRSEIEVIRQRLDNSHPFISENGGGIFIPTEYFSVPIEATQIQSGDHRGYSLITLGTRYATILKHFDSLRVKYRRRRHKVSVSYI